MINLLLAEDEPPILRDIKLELELYSDRFHIAAAVYNGREALDYLKDSSCQIDVLITDIEMPVIGGLDLIQKVNELYPSILCIILTGYSSFDYAKKAISLGVFDYLLKPIEEDALKALLDRVYHKICREHLESNLYNNNPSLNSVLPESDCFSYITCILCVGTFSPYSDYLTAPAAPGWQHLNMEELLVRHLPGIDSYWIIDGKSDNEKNIIITLRKGCVFDKKAAFQNLFHELQSIIPYVNLIVSNPVNTMNEIGTSIQNLRKELNCSFVLGHSQLFFTPSSIELPDSLYQQLTICCDSLALLFRQLDYSAFRKSFRNFIHMMEQNGCPENAVFHFLYDLTTSCCAGCGSSLPRYLKNCISLINDTFVLSDSFDSLADNMLTIYEDLFHLNIKSQEFVNSQNQTMLLIDSYIKLNYNQPINTQTLSQRFNLTPAYLSKLFREYKDISPAEYIVNLRMEKAKQFFLAQPASRIQDIAAEVGYEDALYFSKVFKKNTGFSPKEFVKRMLQVPEKL